MNTYYNNKAVQKKIRTIISEMGLCGCGSVQKYKLIHNILIEADKEYRSYKSLYTESDYNMFELILDVMNRWGLLEHGGSVGGSWITDTGYFLLQFMNEFGSDSFDEWPDWVIDFIDD